jgi:ABC-type uncharacterized transport system fused permease/ATPase subunit
MTERAAAVPVQDDKCPNPRGSVRAYWRLAGAYWKGPQALQAWSLTLISFALVVGNIVVQYGINLWNCSFFNALEQHDQSFAYQAAVLFLALAFAAALVAVMPISGPKSDKGRELVLETFIGEP